MIETQYGKRIKVLRSDNGSEFMSSSLLAYRIFGSWNRSPYLLLYSEAKRSS